MLKEHAVFELPNEDADIDKFVSAPDRDVKHVALSSAVVDGCVKHYAFVLFQKREYGDLAF
jgi:hypothetical protein